MPSPENHGGSGGTHHKVNEFRSNGDNSGSSAIDSIPVIPEMNFDTVNGTNSTEIATVTIPVCNGVLPGPYLDKTAGQIIP